MNITVRYPVVGRTVEDLEHAAQLRLAEFAAGRIGLVVAIDATADTVDMATPDGGQTNEVLRWRGDVLARIITPGYVVVAVNTLARIATNVEDGWPRLAAEEIRALYADEVAS